MSRGDWDIYAQCACGWRERAPFGNRFHIHKEVCPSCGSLKRTWDLVTGRYGDHGFERLPDSEPKASTPSGCLAIHTTTALVALIAFGFWIW